MNTYIVQPLLLRYISFFIIGIFLCTVPMPTHAVGEGVVISEIMYDLPGADTVGSASREWIEVKNTGTSPVDMTGWKLFDGSNHVLNPPSIENGGQGTLIIESGGFAVISANAPQFIIDNPSYSGTLIDSVLSLNNEGDTVKICSATCSASTVVSEVTYTSALGASGDGNSLQLYQSGWIATSTTPGADATGVSTSSGTSGSTSSSSSSTSNPVFTPPPKPVFLDSKKEPTWSNQLGISMPSLFAHVPFTITTTITSPKLDTYATGRFVYTLGDGRVIEKTNSDPVTIEYEDPGTYVLYFEFFEHANDRKPVLSDRVLLEVEDAPIVLSKDTLYGNKVILTNLHSKDIDVSDWKITDGPSSFVFQKNTFLPAKKEVTINKNLYHTYAKNFSLITPTGHTVAVFPSPVSNVTSLAPTPFTQDIPVSDTSPFSDIQPLSVNTTLSTEDSATHIPQDASVFRGWSLFSGTQYWVVLFSFFVVLIGVILFFLLKQKESTLSVEKKDDPSVSTEAQKYTVEEI